MEIMKTIEFTMRIIKSYETLRIPHEKHKNHENLRIQLENNENHENH